MIPIAKKLAGTTYPIGTGTGIGKNWVKKGSRIRNSPEFSGIPLGKHNQAVDVPITKLARTSTRMVPLRFAAFLSMANYMNLLTAINISLETCVLFLPSPMLITAIRPTIPQRKCRNNTLPYATYYKTNGFRKLTAFPPSLLTCQLTYGTMVPTISTSTTSPTLASSLPAQQLGRRTRRKILPPLTLPFVAPFRLNGGKQCTTS